MTHEKLRTKLRSYSEKASLGDAVVTCIGGTHVRELDVMFDGKFAKNHAMSATWLTRVIY